MCTNGPYFCHNRNVYKWLDHVLHYYHDVSSISECQMHPLTSENDSDHLPISARFSKYISLLQGHKNDIQQGVKV